MPTGFLDHLPGGVYPKLSGTILILKTLEHQMTCRVEWLQTPAFLQPQLYSNSTSSESPALDNASFPEDLM